MCEKRDQYDSKEKAFNYDTWIKKSPIVQHIFYPSLRKLVGGDLSGKRCVDYACGTGESTRFLADMNPSELVGVDLSKHMLDMAIEKSSHASNYSRIKYFLRDGAEPIGLGQFDLVFSMFFLHYAESQEMLAKMVKSMFESTRPGGTCVGLVFSPFFQVSDFSKQYKYGIELSLIKGNKLRMFFCDADSRERKFEIHVYSYESAVFEKCFKEAGFEMFEWSKLELDEQYKDEAEFLADFLTSSPLINFKALRPLK